MKFKEFSTEPKGPSKSETDMQNEADWAQHGAFVSAELRAVAEQVFNAIGKFPASLEDLDEAKKLKYIELLKAYSAVPKGPNAIKERKVISGEVNKLLG